VVGGPGTKVIFDCFHENEHRKIIIKIHMEIVEKSSHYKMEGENNGPLMLLLTKRFHLKETQEMQWSKKRGAELRVYCLRGTCVLPEPLPFTRLSPNLFLPKQCQLTELEER